MTRTDRRTFLKQLSAVTASGAAVPMGLTLSAITEASAQASPGDYRALVNIFLYGGNDAYNTVLATDTASWAAYVNQRGGAADGSSSIALLPAGTAAVSSAPGNTPQHLGGVRAISKGARAVHAARQFALHPSLAQTQGLYESGRVAVLANVGTLVAPTSKTDWNNAGFTSKPAKLFSHNDQQSTWQSFGVEGTTIGWAGKMADELRALNGVGNANVDLLRDSLTCISPSGTASVWLHGTTVSPMRSDATVIPGLGTRVNTGSGSVNQVYGSALLHSTMTSFMSTATSTSSLVKDHQSVVKRGMQINGLLGSSLPSFAQAPWGTAGIGNPWVDMDKLGYTSPVDGIKRINPLAMQLQMVARLIDANRVAGLAMKRQFFMVGLGGFDTHDGQMGAHADRLAQLDHALAYFDSVLGQMPSTGDMRANVTTFTSSEFGRSFTNNGDGTDHGWGSHHFIMGGAVNGKEVYGTFPSYGTVSGSTFTASDDQIQNGVLLPTTSVDHLAYTLGRWMGVSANTLVNATPSLSILPNLSNFPAGGRDLGIMKA